MFGRLNPEDLDIRSADGMRGPEMAGEKATMLDASMLPWQEESVVALDWTDGSSAERQQSQIMRYFLSGREVATLSDPEIVITPEERREFLWKLKAGEITTQDEIELLLEVRDPLNNPNIGLTKIFWSIMANPRERQILAVLAGYNETNWQEMNEVALKDFLSTVRPNGMDFRTPVGFMPMRERFLRAIRPRATEAIFEAYERSMRSLEKLLYGKRLEYYQQFEALRQEAGSLETQPKIMIDRVAEQIVVDVQRLTEERADALLARTLIQGDDWRQNSNEYHLNIHHIMRAGVVPAFQVEFEGQEWYFSEPFYLTSGRIAILLYVATRQGMKVRALYRSQPQGLWKYVPDYIRDANKSSGISALGQGYSEDSLWLPIGLQVALAQIEKEAGSKKITVTNPNFFLAGVTKAYDSLADYREALATGLVRGDYYDEVAPDAVEYYFRAKNGRRDAPQTLGLSHDKAPDFETVIASFETQSNLAGKVWAEAFWSRDGQYRWLFCRDAQERVWIGQVETTAPLTSVGVRRDWTVMGELMTPLYEYSRKTGGYGDPTDIKGPCQGMWKNYLSKIPLIREYKQKRM